MPSGIWVKNTCQQLSHTEKWKVEGQVYQSCLALRLVELGLIKSRIIDNAGYLVLAKLSNAIGAAIPERLTCPYLFSFQLADWHIPIRIITSLMAPVSQTSGSTAVIQDEEGLHRLAKTFRFWSYFFFLLPRQCFSDFVSVTADVANASGERSMRKGQNRKLPEQLSPEPNQFK